MNIKPILLGLLAAVIPGMPQKITVQTLLYGTTWQGSDWLHHMGTIFSFHQQNNNLQTPYIFKGN